MVPSLLTLPSESQKRLRTLEQFTELGSGFQIAMRDLDLRGAGDLLGGSQSGFIADIGIEMYTLSKTYNMAGWRVAFAVGNPSIIKTINLSFCFSFISNVFFQKYIRNHHSSKFMP